MPGLRLNSKSAQANFWMEEGKPLQVKIQFSTSGEYAYQVNAEAGSADEIRELLTLLDNGNGDTREMLNTLNRAETIFFSWPTGRKSTAKAAAIADNDEAIGCEDKNLLPCPFCGKVPTMWHNRFGYRWAACENAKCTIAPSGSWIKSENKAIEAWNRRHFSEGEIKQ